MGNLALVSVIPAPARDNTAFPRAAVALRDVPTTRSPAMEMTRAGGRSAARGVTWRGALLVRIVALTLGLLVPAVAAAEPTDPLSRFAGSWSWVGGNAELRAIDDAIEACVKQMNLFIRPIARHRIRKPLQPSTEMVLAAAPGPTLSISRPDRPTIAMPANGQQIRWRDPGGDWFLISLGVDGGVLQQRFEGTSSISFNSYILDSSGSRLTVHTRIVSKRLPAPIEFDTTYEKHP